MVAAVIPAPQLRPARNPTRPVGRWVLVAILAAGLALSVLGWVITSRLAATERAAASLARQVAVAERSEEIADARADLATVQRDALAALVLYRCDTSQIRDVQLCEAARGVWHLPR